MKKKLIAAVAICMTVFALCLVGCGGDKYADDKHVGTWSASEVSYMGMSLEASTVFEKFDITLEGSGKASIDASVGGEEQSGSGKWEPTDTGIKLMDSGLSDESLSMTDADGNLNLEYEGMTVTFKKA